MSISLSSARRIAAGAVGASAVAGAILFGAIHMAQPASVPAPAPTAASGASHVAPVFFGGHHHRHGGIHIA
ncbi:MAG: hypothetical protein QOE52_2391 [Mycobacterium sp.]|nr:hypothetical protein [Mycobacterium sp.]